MELTGQPPHIRRGYRFIDLGWMRVDNLYNNFQKPDSWTFHDEEILRWYEVWRKSQGNIVHGVKGAVR